MRIGDAERSGPPMKIEVVVHVEPDGGYWAEVPALPGCYTQGDTMEELEANLRDVIELFRSIGRSR